MLLQHIVGVLDTELDRLNRLREIVAELAGPAVFLPEVTALVESKPVEEPTPVPAKVQVQETKSVSQRKSSRPAGARRGPSVRRSKTQPEPGALTKSIPAAPVVVSAEALAKDRMRQQQRHIEPTPKPPVGSLGSMIRAMQLQTNLNENA